MNVLSLSILNLVKKYVVHMIKNCSLENDQHHPVMKSLSL